jgi:hypothetical protein
MSHQRWRPGRREASKLGWARKTHILPSQYLDIIPNHLGDWDIETLPDAKSKPRGSCLS